MVRKLTKALLQQSLPVESGFFMAIYLDDIEREYLIKLLEKHSPTFWVNQSIIKKVKADKERLLEIGSCTHIKTKFIGEKTCCLKCESYYEPGMGFSWTRVEEGIEKPTHKGKL